MSGDPIRALLQSEFGTGPEAKLRDDMLHQFELLIVLMLFKDWANGQDNPDAVREAMLQAWRQMLIDQHEASLQKVATVADSPTGMLLGAWLPSTEEMSAMFYRNLELATEQLRKAL